MPAPRRELIAVEPRMLFDGAAAAAMPDPHPEVVQVADATDVEASLKAAPAAAEVPAEVPADAGPSAPLAPRLLVIDNSVPDWQSIAAAAAPGTEVMVIDGRRDGLVQMAERLSGHTPYSSIHVVSHGSEGRLELGTRVIDAASIARFSSELSVIGDALTADGDLLLYGCDIGAGQYGADFLAAMARATRADVAASTDRTGTSRLGGDWVLEASSGVIDASSAAFSADPQWGGILAAPSLTIVVGAVQDDVGTGAHWNAQYTDDRLPSGSVIASYNGSSAITPAGDTGLPLTRVVTTADLTSVGAPGGVTLNSSVMTVDAGDSIRMVAIAANTGDAAAYDVAFGATLPAGYTAAGDVANFRITLGNQTVVFDGTSTTLDKIQDASTHAAFGSTADAVAAFFDGRGIELVDGAGGALAAGKDGGGLDVTTGDNLAIASWDLKLQATVAPLLTIRPMGTVLNWAASDGGASLVGGTVPSDDAAISIAGDCLFKTIVTTSNADTTGTNLAVGETVQYQLRMLVPEGRSPALVLTDQLPAGMALVSVDSLSLSGTLSSTRGNAATLLANAQSTTLGTDNSGMVAGTNGAATLLQIDFGDVTNSDTTNSQGGEILVTYTAVVLDQPVNQQGHALPNAAKLTTDTGLPGEVTQAVDALSVTVVEPSWSIAVTPDSGAVSRGSVATFTLTVTADALSPVPGYEGTVSLSMPAGLTYVSGSLASVSGSAGVLVALDATAGTATIDRLDPGEAVTLRFQAQVGTGATEGATLSPGATVRWTSMPGTVADVSPLYAPADDAERTGADGVGGALNDHAATDTGSLVVSSPVLNVYAGALQTDQAADGKYQPLFALDNGVTPITQVPASTLVSAPGAGNPLLAAVTSANVATLNVNVFTVDAQDSVRMAVAVENTGQAAAYDVIVRDTLPTGYGTGDVSNLRITLGDGTVIYDGSTGTLANIRNGSTHAVFGTTTDALAAFFGPAGIELVDAGGAGRLAAGRSGATVNGTGSNIAIATYDLQLVDGSDPLGNLSSTATVSHYAGSDGGTDLSLVDPADAAIIGYAPDCLFKTIVGTGQSHTTNVGGVEQVVIGETVSYQIEIVLPEGTSPLVVLRDTLAGMALVSVDSIVFSSADVTSSAGTAAQILARANDNGLTDGSGIGADGSGNEDARLTIDFGTITNANRDNATAETIIVRYTALVLDKTGNQAGTNLPNAATLTTQTGTAQERQQATDTATVRVVEPAWNIAVSPHGGAATQGATTVFTITVTNPAGAGAVAGFDGTVSLALPTGLTYVPGSLQLSSASAGVNVTVDTVALTATIDRLDPGESVTLSVSGTVGTGVAVGSPLTVPASVAWTSIPGAATDLSAFYTGSSADTERTGADGPGGALDDYATTDVGSVVVAAPNLAMLTIVQTSEAGTSPAAGNPLDPGAPETVPVTVGEIVRYRAIVCVPEGSTSAAELRLVLPDGLVFLNDGSTALALISDAGGLTSSTLSGGSLAMADGTPDGAPSQAGDIAALRPTQVLANSGAGNAIANLRLTPTGSPGTNAVSFASGDGVRFLLGDLTNANADADCEWVVVEFNAVVTDQLSNQAAVSGVGAATSLPVSFDFRSGASTVASSDVDRVTLVEPAITGLDKHFYDRVGNTVTFEVTFTNGGDSTLHDVRVLDDFAGATNLSFGGSTTVTIVTGSATNASTGSALDLRIPTLAPGATVTVRYDAVVGDLTQVVPARNVVVTGTSLSAAGAQLVVGGGADGTGAPIAGVAPSVTTGERTGADGPGPDATTLDNYAAVDGAGLGLIAGRLWNDTPSPDGSFGAGDRALGGVTLQLTWAGPNGVFGDGDDLVATVVTSTNPATLGQYAVSGLPGGLWRVTAPTSVADGTAGTVAVSGDSGASGPRNDGVIELTLGEGTAALNQDFLYLNGRPPAGTDKTFRIAEDQPVPLKAADFGYSDPDGDAFQAVRIDTLPTAGTLLLYGSRVTAGQVIPVDQLPGLMYVPPPDANTDTLPVPPTFTFSVQDTTGRFDPVPNTFTFLVDPVNDPPTAPVVERIVDNGATADSPSARIGALPPPTDPEAPPQVLTVTVDGVPPAAQGTFLLPDGSIVKPGQQLTSDQLQNLRYVPNPADTTAYQADGLKPGGRMDFTVSDGAGGTAQGAIIIRVRPPSVPPPPAPPPPGSPVPTPPPAPSPTPSPTPDIPPVPRETPFEPRRVPPPFIPGEVVRRAGNDARPETVELRLSDVARANDFDAFKPWTANDAFNQKPERAAPQVEEKADDCVPVKPKVKAKPRARAVLGDAIAKKLGEPVQRPFSQQIDAEKKRLRPPAKVPPRVATPREC